MSILCGHAVQVLVLMIFIGLTFTHIHLHRENYASDDFSIRTTFYFPVESIKLGDKIAMMSKQSQFKKYLYLDLLYTFLYFL